MPTRVSRSYDEEPEEPGKASAKPVPVTDAMLDEAAEMALEGVDDFKAVAIKRLWAMDTGLDATNAYHRSQMEARDRSNFSRVENIAATVVYVLTQEQVKRVVELYPEFDITFRNDRIHDHAMAAVTKALDQKLLESRVPPGMRYKDIGGSVLSHVEKGNVFAIVVHGDHDMKDPVRRVHTMLALKRIASGERKCAGGERSVMMAQSILAGEGKYYIDKDARLDTTRTFYAVMNQVYDIPIEGLPVLMDSGDIRVAEFKVHFSNDFFELNSGELPDVEGRYEIDRQRDTFKMGFIGSGAPWYDHKFSDFARYGTDQILEGHSHMYSFKVIERRGDTITIRMMRIGPGAKPNRRQYYALPGVDVVDVDGFELFEGTVASTGPLKPKTWRFPANIWQTLLREAAVKAARGGLDLNQLVDTYRVAVVPHQLNGVPIAPGTRVDNELLVPMVVHAGFAAYADILLFESEVDHTMRAVQAQRGIADETTIYKAFRVFVDAVTKVATTTTRFFSDLGGLLSSMNRDKLRDALVMWRPVARMKRIHAANVLALHDSDKDFLGSTESVHIDHMKRFHYVDMLKHAAARPEVAAQVVEVCGEYMTEEMRGYFPKSEQKDSPEQFDERIDSSTETGTTAPPTYATDEPGEGVTVFRPPPIVNRSEQRQNAILEAIAENEIETEKIERTCLGYLREIAVGGGVNVAALRRHKARMANPDMWRIANGVIVESALGLDPVDFAHAAVVCLKKSEQSASHVWSVSEKEYTGHESSTGKPVVRLHHVVQDSTYSGWVFVNDALKIHNGPDCLYALTRALDISAEYEITMHQGGPGAGKTTSIVSSYVDGEVVICPVKASMQDTRKRLADKFPDKDKAYWRKHVRTVDSLLVNFLKSDRDMGFSAKYAAADEAFMCSSGKWHAVFRLLGVERVRAYGDEKQIPHIPRVDSPKLYVKMVPDVWHYHWMVYRCQPEIMAMWSPYYDNKLRTPLGKGGKVMRLYTHVGLKITDDTALLCMYQASKLELRRLFPKHKGPLMTVHESEGKTFDMVVLFNFELRNRAADDATYLYHKQDYGIVATSRSRHVFIYVKYNKQEDFITRAIDRASDPRRVMAVMDVETAGVSKEF